MKSLARSKIRDLQACEEELKAQQAKAEQLLELARKYKLEIATLRNGGFVSSSMYLFIYPIVSDALLYRRLGS